MLDHPGIQRILARAHDPELGEVYVVPWLPDGTTSLRSLLRNDAVFTEQEAVELMRQLLDALACRHVHSRSCHEIAYGNWPALRCQRRSRTCARRLITRSTT